MSFPRPDINRRSSGSGHGRGAALMLALIAIIMLASACLPADLAAKLVTPSTSGRVQGEGPLTSIWNASKEKAACGLTATQLSAMLIVPTSFESGTKSPSPMTLSRWDNVNVWSLNKNLFPFAATDGPYTGAFYSPGIGLWQFDSAGGWNLTAASAIDTDTSAMQAATTIAYRWCNAPADRLADPVRRRAYAWAAWYYCNTDSRCEDAYDSLLTDDKLDIGIDSSIDHLGGMEKRVCNVLGLGEGLTCYYIDPARAQGSRSWTFGTYDPARPDYLTPLPKPFYDIESGGNEYRIWVRDDTGFDIGITAVKPVTSNARTSVVWSRASNLCDITVQRGDCAKARVADTPWGPRTVDPFGSFDSSEVSVLNRVTLTGWTIDPDTNDPTPVDISVDGTTVKRVTANKVRTDVSAVVSGYGDEHGFETTVDLTGGEHSVCATAVNIGEFGTGDKSMGCRSVMIEGEPIGALQSVVAAVGGVNLRGYAFDADTDDPLQVQVYADDKYINSITADVARSDLAKDHPTFGPNHGFSKFVRLRAGARRVCAVAVNAAPSGSSNTTLGCTTVTVDGQPFGSFDSVSTAPGGFRVWGWAFDPETADAKVRVTVDGVLVKTALTGVERPDVAGVYPNLGVRHGFNAVIPSSPGTHSVCVTAVNEGAGGADQPLGCRSVTVVAASPIGNLEFANRGFGGVILGGWAIDPDTVAPINLRVTVTGEPAKTFRAADSRPDVGVAYPGYGENHGFLVYVAIPAAPTTVCVQLINVGAPMPNSTLSCRVY
ncbi:MAG: hypothetical protein F2520_04335 [Actinobacteria bacterium]|uniref:Unannotated protein n=1 Tax=freshwater metagenome TaxID=449393 RepID=A0A6J5YB54_9ZZZZ|nr:hypothetical protein [Actinomycetota bacterium]